MKTDRTTKALLGILVFLGLGSPQTGMALQGPCDDFFSGSFLLEECTLAEQGNAAAQRAMDGLGDELLGSLFADSSRTTDYVN